MSPTSPASATPLTSHSAPEPFDQAINDAYALSYKELAELSQSTEGPLGALYAICLDQRLQLHWGRVANWQIWTNGRDEREGIRLANIEVGATREERVVNALNGRLDLGAGEAEARLAASRESDLIDQSVEGRPQ